MDLKPLRKPAILFMIAGFVVGMAFAPSPRFDGWAELGALCFILYLVLGD